MGSEPTLLEVGRIERPHGIRGEVLVRLTTDRDERLRPGSVLDSDAGALEVLASRPHKQRWIVSFTGIEDRSRADSLTGNVLRAEPIDDPDTMWVHELIGCELVDSEGVMRGRVESVQENPASDLLVLDGGALVPLRFIVSGPEAGRIVVDAPEGLFDL